MTEKTISGLLIVIGVIHLLPLSGVFGATKLESLYAVPIQGNDLEILMRHRAVLFGLLGAFFVYAAFVPAVQPLAFVAAFVSIASFFYLAFSVGGYNSAIGKVVIADVVAAVCLVAAVILYLVKR